MRCGAKKEIAEEEQWEVGGGEDGKEKEEEKEK